MGLPDRIRQDGPCLVAALAVGEGDAEGHGDVGQVIAAAVPDLFRADLDLEAVGFGAARREDVDVDRRAAADRGQQEVNGSEVGSLANADRDLAAAVVDDGVPAVADPFDAHPAVRVLSHGLHDATATPGLASGRRPGRVVRARPPLNSWPPGRDAAEVVADRDYPADLAGEQSRCGEAQVAAQGQGARRRAVEEDGGAGGALE